MRRSLLCSTAALVSLPASSLQNSIAAWYRRNPNPSGRGGTAGVNAGRTLEIARLRLVSHLALAAAFALAGCADPTAPDAASPEALGGHNLAQASAADRVRFDVTFTIPGGTCGLTTTVTGTGVYQVVSRVSETPAGGLRIAFHESAHGTATGADGSQYRFNYAVNYTVIDVDDPTTLPIVLDLVDHFNLLGQGRAPDVKVFLKGLFLFDGSVPLIPIGDPVIRGGLTCDPI
jgi:hypothetical protein